MRAGSVILVSTITLAGCLGYPGPRSVVNEDPAVKIPAIRRAAETGDRSVIPQLVKDLESDDAAVRLASIKGLQDLTGETHDYHWWDDEAIRRPAVRRWQNVIANRPLEDGVAELMPHPTTAPATQPSTQPATLPTTREVTP
ncbi:MAG: HEAT repeat domain-containing protein [Tepidisphaeraceae bacterium]